MKLNLYLVGFLVVTGSILVVVESTNTTDTDDDDDDGSTPSNTTKNSNSSNPQSPSPSPPPSPPPRLPSFMSTFKIQYDFIEDLKDPKTAKFQELEKKIQDGAADVFKNNEDYEKTKVLKFKPGSVIAETLVEFASGTDVSSHMEEFKKAVNSESFGDLTTIKDSVEVIPSIDGIWSDWKISGECVNNTLTEIRKCVDKKGGGTDCIGIAKRIMECTSASCNLLPSIVITGILALIASLYF